MNETRTRLARVAAGLFGATVLLAACAPAPTATTGSQGSAPSVATAAPAAPAAPSAVPTQSSAIVAGSGIVKGPNPTEAKALTGAGATFPAALYSKWFNDYEKVGGVKVNYQSIGSGGGIKSIQDQTVDFGATDGPMTDDQLKDAKGGKVLHIPAALGAVVVTYNLPGITAPLKFSADTISGIFLGKITKWNDPKIAAENAGVNLPNQDISTVHRSDGSGTTYIFTDYLSAISPEWKSKVGTATSVDWPNGIGGKGNEGVAGEVKQNPYSIGYVELIYALQNKLGVGDVKNKAGKFVTPSLDSVTAAAAANAGNVPADLRASIVDAPGDGSYPISGFTWLLVYEKQTDQAKAIAITRLVWWATHDGQKFNKDLGYAPLPDDIVKKGEVFINSITVNGTKAFPGS